MCVCLCTWQSTRPVQGNESTGDNTRWPHHHQLWVDRQSRPPNRGAPAWLRQNPQSNFRITAILPRSARGGAWEKVKLSSHVDPKYFSRSKVYIKEYFEDTETFVHYKNHVEIISLDPKRQPQRQRQRQRQRQGISDKVEKLKQTIVQLNERHSIVGSWKIKTDNWKSRSTASLQKTKPAIHEMSIIFQFVFGCVVVFGV